MKPPSTRSLLVTTAILESGTGLSLILFPSELAWLLLGVFLDTPVGLVVARIAGVALLSISLNCWLSRAGEPNPNRGSLIKGLLLYNIGAVAILVYAGGGLHLTGIALWPAVLAHIVLTGWCFASLRQKP